MLSEYGLCRAGEGDGGGEGTFLKFAIKHLLALNVKLKPNFSSSNKENSQYDKQLSHHDHFKISEDEIGSDAMDLEMVGAETCETVAGKKDDSDGTTSNGMPSHLDLEKENSRVGSDGHFDNEDNDDKREKNSNHALNVKTNSHRMNVRNLSS